MKNLGPTRSRDAAHIAARHQQVVVSCHQPWPSAHAVEAGGGRIPKGSGSGALERAVRLNEDQGSSDVVSRAASAPIPRTVNLDFRTEATLLNPSAARAKGLREPPRLSQASAPALTPATAQAQQRQPQPQQQRLASWGKGPQATPLALMLTRMLTPLMPRSPGGGDGSPPAPQVVVVETPPTAASLMHARGQAASRRPEAAPTEEAAAAAATAQQVQQVPAAAQAGPADSAAADSAVALPGVPIGVEGGSHGSSSSNGAGASGSHGNADGGKAGKSCAADAALDALAAATTAAAAAAAAAAPTTTRSSSSTAAGPPAPAPTSTSAPTGPDTATSAPAAAPSPVASTMAPAPPTAAPPLPPDAPLPPTTASAAPAASPSSSSSSSSNTTINTAAASGDQEGEAGGDRPAPPTLPQRTGLPPPPPLRFPPQHYTEDQVVPGATPYKPDYPLGPRFQRVDRIPLAGGSLEIVRWEGSRMLRVWLPAGFSPLDALREGGYPALFLHDGQNLFDPELSISGACWRAAETAAQLIASGQLPPFVVVGIDHPGPARPYEYTPVKPGNGPDNWRPDAASWPGGGVWEYLERLAEEVVPWLTQAYALSPRACDRILGGSSFGGIATLCAAMRYPHVWGASLVESPSLWIDKGNFLATTITQHKGRWPARMFVGMGSQEHTGVRPPGAGRLEADEGLQGAALQLTATLAKQAHLKEGRSLMLELQPGATHNEQAWANRLPRALAFLGRPWWQRQLRGKRGHLYFTVPRRLRPGVPAVLLVNKPRSTSLHAATSLELHHGYNMAWEVKPADQPLRPAPWVEEGPDTWLTSTTEEPAAQPTTDSSTDKGDSQWWVAPLAVPSQAYEMHFALSGQVEVPGEQAGHSQQQKMWDSNAGHNFYMRVAPWTALDLLAVVPGSGDESQATRLERARQAVSSNPQPAADKNSNKPFFTLPEKLVAGGPCRVFFNRTRCWGLRHQPNIKLHYGWNGWDSKELPGGAAQVDLKPTQLWRNEDTDWWCAELAVPETAQELNFAFTNGGDVWDSNGGHNYVVRVVGGRGAGSGGGEGPVPRSVQHEEALPHGQGTMHIVTLARRAKGEVSQSKQMRWADEKVLRVWTPPGWSLEQTPPGGWPVLYLSDGQNKFEDWLAHQGVSWRAGYQASDLIAAGELPPFLVVGIDSPGPMRSFNYLPYEPGTGAGGFRGDAERWPGGGVSAYMQRVSEEIMPLVQSRFGAAADPDRNAFGGGSFGGVAALYAAMHYPHLFGSVLAESPSFWIAEGRFLADMAAHRGALPERLFLGCGTREYSATRDHCRPEVDALLLHYCSEAARILDEKGCKGEQGRLRFLVEEGAGHHEGAWQWRLSGALRFLLAPWWAHFRP